MLKRLIVCFYVILFGLIIPEIFSCASEVSIEKAVSVSNQELFEKYGIADYFDISLVNQTTYNEKKVVVYGEPHGTQDSGTGEYRYAGYAPNREDFPNPDYPDDSVGYSNLDYKNYFFEPWNDTFIKSLPLFQNIKPNFYTTRRAEYLENFLAGMEIQHPSRFLGDRSIPWIDYYHVVLPPTQYTDGIAWVIWKNADNSIHYATSLMQATSKLNNISATCTINTPTTIDQTITTVNATFDFTITSNVDLVSYEIFDVTSNVAISNPLVVAIPAGNTTISNSLPIIIDVPSNSNLTQLSIKVIDANGVEAIATASKTITKVITTVGTSEFDADSNGVIRADNRGAEGFDVSQGIPTTEDVYINVLADEYVYEEDYGLVSGFETYTVNVTKKYSYRWWDSDDVQVDLNGDGDYDDPGETTGGYDYDSSDAPIIKTYSIPKSYAFYLIDRLELYGLKSADLHNDVLPGGGETLLTNGYSAPTITIVESDLMTDHLQQSNTISTITLNLTNDVYQSVDYDPITGEFNIVLKEEEIGGSSNSSKPSQPNEDFTTVASAALSEVKVRNDEVVFNGVTYMDGLWYDATAPLPMSIPAPPAVGPDVLYKNNLTIPISVRNGSHSTTGEVSYDRIVSVNSVYGTTIAQPITGINDVLVHSPIVCFTDVPNDLTYNQVIDIDMTRPNLVLDQVFAIDFPNSGLHQSIPGYGNRDYSSYIKSKQIKFSFDTYYGNDKSGTYIRENEWFNVPTSDETPSFYIPYWVTEGDNSVLFRTFSNNTPANYTDMWEYDANLSSSKYYAVNAVDVTLVGQIYDFKLIGTSDTNFDNLFSDASGNRLNSLYTGINDKEGTLDTSHVNILPLMPGTNTATGFETKVAKKGHSVFFSVKTNGNMKDKEDYILVKPTFYHVDAAGINRQQVDILYTSDGRLQKLMDAPKSLAMSLNNQYTNISESVLTNTATANINLFGLDGRASIANYLENYLWSESKSANNIGASNFLALDYQQKVFVGDTSNLPLGVSTTDALTGIQEFYGMYSIPSNSMIVPTGTAFNNVLSSEISGGYIILSFDFESIDNFIGDPTDIHLSYDSGVGNMYQIEGYQTLQNGFDLNHGDAVFFYTDKSADQDFINIGTH